MLHLAERARQGEVCKGQMTSMSADIPKWDRNLKWEKEKKRPMLRMRRRKRANFGQSPSGH